MVQFLSFLFCDFWKTYEKMYILKRFRYANIWGRCLGPEVLNPASRGPSAGCWFPFVGIFARLFCKMWLNSCLKSVFVFPISQLVWKDSTRCHDCDKVSIVCSVRSYKLIRKPPSPPSLLPTCSAPLPLLVPPPASLPWLNKFRPIDPTPRHRGRQCASRWPRPLFPRRGKVWRWSVRHSAALQGRRPLGCPPPRLRSNFICVGTSW